MHASHLTVKGQVTIPVEFRRQIGLRPGDMVEFSCQENKIFITKRKTDITAAFGLLNANKKVSIKDMEKAIQKGKERNK